MKSFPAAVPALSARVVVIDSSCAGKSTFAHQLAEARRCACIELDELFWSENWTPKPEREFLQLVTAASADEAWVAAGNYSVVRNALWARATTIVWLNYGLPLLLWRGLKRTVKRIALREITLSLIVTAKMSVHELINNLTVLAQRAEHIGRIRVI